MEDRMNAGLLFVQLEGSARGDLPTWDEELRALPGISRVSWWNNLHPHRQDWVGKWMKAPDFETLAVCEIDGPIGEVRRPEGVRSILFQRSPRPSQGVLRLPTLGLSVVMISPTDATDDKAARALRDWGDFVHFPGIVEANIPGYALVTPYENVAHDAPRFLHFYEFSEPDAEAVFNMTRACVAQRFGAKPGTPAFDNWATYPGMILDYLGNFTRREIGAKN